MSKEVDLNDIEPLVCKAFDKKRAGSLYEWLFNIQECCMRDLKNLAEFTESSLAEFSTTEISSYAAEYEMTARSCLGWLYKGIFLDRAADLWKEVRQRKMMKYTDGRS